MTDVLSLPAVENLSSEHDSVVLAGDSIATALRRRIPLFVARTQLYYWTRDWQEGERASLEDLEAGRYRVFSDGTSAARWLLTDEE